MVAQFTQQRTLQSTKPVRKHISLAHWQAFQAKVESFSMEPEEFLNHWACTYEEIARICRCSRNTVANWFCKSGKRPSEMQKIWLGTAHKLLLVTRL